MFVLGKWDYIPHRFSLVQPVSFFAFAIALARAAENGVGRQLTMR